MRAIYVREPNVGFKRIGWLFEKCGHIQIDKKESAVVEKVKELSQEERTKIDRQKRIDAEYEMFKMPVGDSISRRFEEERFRF